MGPEKGDPLYTPFEKVGGREVWGLNFGFLALRGLEFRAWVLGFRRLGFYRFQYRFVGAEG